MFLSKLGYRGSRLDVSEKSAIMVLQVRLQEVVTMSEIREVTSIEEWESIRDANGDRKVLIMKHSTT